MEERIRATIKEALLSGDKFKAETLKMVLATATNVRIEKKRNLTDDEVVAVIQKEIKKRKEAAELYSTAGEQARALQEMNEVSILEAFVPKVIDGDELTELVENWVAKKQSSELTIANFGVLMKDASQELTGADKAQLAQMLRSKLQ